MFHFLLRHIFRGSYYDFLSILDVLPDQSKLCTCKALAVFIREKKEGEL
jgi:hypothetical protein